MAAPAVSAILSNPIAQYILLNLATELIGKITPDRLSPYEQLMHKQLEYSRSILPMLSKEAMGVPSLATQAAMRQVNQQIGGLQQALSATAQRNVPTKTTIGRSEQVGQQRYQQAKTQAYSNILAQQQQQARQALLGLYGQAAPAMLGMEMQERQARSQIPLDLAMIIAEYKKGKNVPEFRSKFAPYMEMLFKLLLTDRELAQELPGALETLNEEAQ